MKIPLACFLFAIAAPVALAADPPGDGGGKWKNAGFQVVPNEPAFRATSPGDAPLGWASFYRMSTEHGCTDKDLRVFEMASNGSKSNGGFLEFLALRVRAEKSLAAEHATVRYVYIGFKNRNDPGVQKLYRLLYAATMLQIDGKVADIEIDLSVNHTRLEKDHHDEFYLVEPKQLKVRLSNGLLVDADLLIRQEFTAEPYGYLGSLVNKDHCKKAFDN